MTPIAESKFWVDAHKRPKWSGDLEQAFVDAGLCSWDARHGPHPMDLAVTIPALSRLGSRHLGKVEAVWAASPRWRPGGGTCHAATQPEATVQPSECLCGAADAGSGLSATSGPRPKARVTGDIDPPGEGDEPPLALRGER